MLRTLSTILVAAAVALAQDPSTPSPEAQGPALPAPHSNEARKMVEGAVDKMLAYARGRFRTTESQDSAMMRNAGLPIGSTDTEIDGGWSLDTIWGEWGGREFVIANGRMLAKVDGKWRLRRRKLAGGVDLPFMLDPSLLFTVLKQHAKPAMDVVHVQAARLRGKPVVILTSKLVDDAALEFADAGVVPDAGGGFGAVIMFGGLGGGFEPPRPELETYLAFTVDPDNGDLLRFAARTYLTDESAANIVVQGAGGAAGGGEQEDEQEAVDPNAPLKWRRGFPVKKPAKDQSVMTYRVDFEELGRAQPPELEPEHRVLLKLR